jgi:hypothetical protein
VVSFDTGESEADEQVRNYTHTFSTHKEQQSVISSHHHQHKESEQTKVGKETLNVRVMRHVTERVDVHQERDETDRDHHGESEFVEQETQVELKSTQSQSGTKATNVHSTFMQYHFVVAHADAHHSGAEQTDSKDWTT